MGNYAKFSEDLLKLDCKTSYFVTKTGNQKTDVQHVELDTRRMFSLLV